MDKRRSACIAFALIGICVGCSSSDSSTSTDSPSATGSPGASTTSGAPVTASYADIQAIFDKSCVSCHGGDSPKEGISLVSHEALMRGGEPGPVVIPNEPENSLLIHVLRGSHGKKLMPMGGSALPEADIQKVETWIKDGAKA
jgi:mono/diheme cytochrome c family protein